MSADPSKVNAMRKLTEAAEAVGWHMDREAPTVGAIGVMSPGRRFGFQVADGAVYHVGSHGRRDDRGIPADLMALLLEAAR